MRTHLLSLYIWPIKKLRACIILPQFTAKGKYAALSLIYKWKEKYTKIVFKSFQILSSTNLVELMAKISTCIYKNELGIIYEFTIFGYSPCLIK